MAQVYQYKIFLAVEDLNFHYISKRQNLFTKSFIARLKALRSVLSYIDLVVLKASTIFTSEDKFRVVLNLKHNNLVLNLDNNFVLTRRNGLSTFSNLHTLFSKSYFCLYNLSILPFTEKVSNRFSFKYRPFRASRTEFYALKNFFFIKNNFFSINIKVKFMITSQSRKWLLKNFPNKRNWLKTWLSYFKNFSAKSFKIRFDFSDISYTFFNYLFSNLVGNFIINLLKLLM